jgi:hypothetical protein
MNGKKSNVAKWSLIIGIVVLFNLFINVSLDMVFESPEYDEFCESNLRYPTKVEELSQEEIDAQNQKWEECQSEYDSAREEYEKKVFVTLISIGVVIFLISLIGKLNYVVATSLSLAAVLNFIIASMRYWSSAEQLFRVIILGLALAILVWIGIKKFSD